MVHEEFNKSDHWPLLIETEFYATMQQRRPSGPRRFEARWLQEESVDSIVQAAWDRAKSLSGSTLAQATELRT